MADDNTIKYKEAGRRIKAALVSFLEGKEFIDKTLMASPPEPGPGWDQIAEHLLKQMKTIPAEQLPEQDTNKIHLVRRSA